jgi:hypothetical protein
MRAITARAVVVGADHHTVRPLEILDGCTLAQKLGI